MSYIFIFKTYFELTNEDTLTYVGMYNMCIDCM